MKADAYITQSHHADHALPVWDALSPEFRGDLYVGHDYATFAYVTALGFDALVGMPPPSDIPVIIASGNELPAVKKAILLEHGVGQTYESVSHVCWPGGEGRDHVVLFVCPNERVAKKNWLRYPETPCAIVGSPHVEVLRTLPPYPLPEQRIAITGHWESSLVPELRGGFAWFEKEYERLCRARPESFVLHGHPKSQDFFAWKAKEWGVEFEPSFEQLTQRAWCLVADNTCVVPDTPVLCEDLVWRPAGELVAGDRLIGCDEERTRQLRRPRSDETVAREDRRLRTTEVISNVRKEQPCLTVRTTHGDLTVSTSHPWLVRRKVTHHYLMDGRKPGQRWKTRSYHWRWDWINADELKPGDEVAHFVKPWELEDTRDAGWLAGMFDGEGCLHIGQKTKHGSQRVALSVAQNEGPVLDELYRVLSDRKLHLYLQEARGGRGNRCMKVSIQGSLAEHLSFLGSVRPMRLLRKMQERQGWDGASVSAAVEKATVLSVEAVGIQEVCVLATSERTFIANGFMAHNSALFEWAAIGRPVVVVSPIWYRREIEHGLRFWEFADLGPHVSDPAVLESAIDVAICDPAPIAMRRQSICLELFGSDLSAGASRRAAKAIEEVLSD